MTNRSGRTGQDEPESLRKIIHERLMQHFNNCCVLTPGWFFFEKRTITVSKPVSFPLHWKLIELIPNHLPVWHWVGSD
jgi:hypothetical protein